MMPRAEPLEIRFPTADETEVIQAFFRKEWGERHIFSQDRGLLEWQFNNARTPFLTTDGIAALTIWSGGELVGMQGLVYADFRRGSETVPGVWLCNLMAAGAWRAHGVGLKLMTAVHRLPVKVIATAGINPSLIPVYEKLRYATLPDLPRFVQAVDAAGFAGLTGHSSAPHAAAGGRAGDDRVATLARFDERWEALFRTAAGEGYLGTERSATFMNWRYVDHPVFRHEVAALEAGASLAGLSVHRIERIAGRSESVMRLLEFWAADRDAAATLLAHLRRRAAAAGAAMVDHYNSALAHWDTFVAQGWFDAATAGIAIPALFQPFDPRPRPIAVAVRQLDRRPADAEVAYAGLCVLKSDGDQDRPNQPRDSGEQTT